jgi:nitrogenase molybdenum-iron protein beta chain
VAELRAAGDSRATVALGPLASSAAAQALALKCHVPCEILELPIGLTATDKFIDTLRRVAGVSVPDSINRERGQLLDVMTDMHQYTYGKKVALAGDPDQLVALVDFLVTMDMQPIHIVSGTPGKKTLERMRPSLDKLGRPVNVKIPSDLYQLHQWIKQEPVDLIIGNTYGKYIARDENIPFLRHGFPILDRVGHSYFPTVGYCGAMRLLEQILGVLMDKQDREAPEESFELVM